MSSRFSMSKLFTSIFGSWKKQRKPYLQKEKFISLFANAESMVNDVRNKYTLFLKSTRKADLKTMCVYDLNKSDSGAMQGPKSPIFTQAQLTFHDFKTEDLTAVDIIIERAECLVSVALQELKDIKQDFSKRKTCLRRQIGLVRHSAACAYYAVNSWHGCEKQTNVQTLLRSLQKDGLISKTYLDDILNIDVCGVNRVNKNTV